MTSATRKLTHPFMRTFDTHKYIKLLKSKGVKEPQAEIFMQAISDSREADFAALATKEQLESVKMQVNRIEEDIKDIREEMKDFRKEIRTMFRWTVGLTITGLAATATMLALVLPLLLKH